METQTRYDLNAAIENWRNELAAQPNLATDDRRELETHLRDLISEFRQRGLNDEESFWLACKRVGQPQQLGKEFVKADLTKKLLNHKLAIFIALAGMWLLACAGVFAFIHSSQWWFIGILGATNTIWQTVTFYLAWTGVQLPAAAFAGVIIGSSGFAYPLRTTFLTVGIYHLFFSVLRVASWPWTTVNGLDQWVLIMTYLASMLLLIGVGVLAAWLMPTQNQKAPKRA